MNINDYQQYIIKQLDTYNDKTYIKMMIASGAICRQLLKPTLDSEYKMNVPELAEKLGDMLSVLAVIASYYKIDMEDVLIYNVYKRDGEKYETEEYKNP